MERDKNKIVELVEGIYYKNLELEEKIDELEKELEEAREEVNDKNENIIRLLADIDELRNAEN